METRERVRRKYDGAFARKPIVTGLTKSDVSHYACHPPARPLNCYVCVCVYVYSYIHICKTRRAYNIVVEVHRRDKTRALDVFGGMFFGGFIVGLFKGNFRIVEIPRDFPEDPRHTLFTWSCIDSFSSLYHTYDIGSLLYATLILVILI